MTKRETQYVELYGEFMWAKLFESNRDLKGPDGVWEESDGRYTINVLLDEENYKKLKDTGSAKVGKKMEDGRMNVQFTRRHTEKMYPNYGGPPTVVHADGKTPWDEDEDGYIGNGSEGIVYLAVYKAKKAFGTRLNAVQVIKHVVFEKTGIRFNDYSDKAETVDMKDTESDQVNDDDLEDDEIPF